MKAKFTKDISNGIHVGDMVKVTGKDTNLTGKVTRVDEKGIGLICKEDIIAAISYKDFADYIVTVL